MTPEEAARVSTADVSEACPNWPRPLSEPDDDGNDAISSGWAIAVVGFGYFVLTLIVLCLSAKVVGLW